MASDTALPGIRGHGSTICSYRACAEGWLLSANRHGAVEVHDVVLVGGGIMSATLGVLLRRLQPDWSIAYERLDEVAGEASAA